MEFGRPSCSQQQQTTQEDAHPSLPENADTIGDLERVSLEQPSTESIHFFGNLKVNFLDSVFLWRCWVSRLRSIIINGQD